MRIAIIGAGRMGRALEHLLKQHDHEIRLFDSEPGKVANQPSLEEIVKGTDGNFLCVPSWVMRTVLEDIRPLLQPSMIIVSLAKGLERETCTTMGELLEEMLPKTSSFVLLAGPTMAEEIIAGNGAAAIAATTKQKTFDSIAELFKETPLQLEWSDDLRSVALASVLKNVYALGLGIFSALDRGGNDLGCFFSRMLQEMIAVGEELGATKKILLGTAGVGDLVCTGFSPHSRNRQTGEAIVKTGNIPHGSEGVSSLPPLLSLLGEKKSIAPIAQAIERVVIGHEDAREVFAKMI